MKLPDLFINAVSTFDGKALVKAEKTVASFGKNVAKSLGVAFGTAGVVAFGKASVKAFAEDEAAAVRLTKAVNNLGLGFEDTRITRFIADLEKSAAVADDILRPAFQTLISTTGSVTKSQDLLTLALDISAGSGIDAAEVAKDLSLAYLGQSKGIAKYNTGLTKTELTAAGFLTIQEKLTEQYSGQNAARLDTYAGKVGAVQVAYGNLQETVGSALVDAFMKLAGDTTTEDLTESVDNLADSLASVVELTGQVAAPFVGLAKLFNDASGAYVKLLYKVTGATFMGNVADRQYGGDAANRYRAIEETANAKARAKAEADAARRAKEILALTKKQQIAEKNKLSLSKAAAVFDSNRISIAAALQATYDKETRLRLEALMAIEDEDGATALARIGELAVFQKNADLQKLAGVKTISSATLEAINTQLLTELAAIDSSKMAEADKEIARNAAFGKYNAAILAAGELADKASYNERVQIQLTEIARLASLSKSTNAAITATNLREQAELNMIDRVAKAQKAADDARLSALQTYINTLAKAGTGPSANASSIQKMTPSQAEAALAKEPLSVATALTPSQISGLRYAAQAQDAYEKSLAQISLTDAIAQGSLTQGLNSGLSLAAASSGARYAAQAAATYNLNFTTGVISQPDEFVGLIQDTIQRLNRAGDSLTTAGSL